MLGHKILQSFTLQNVRLYFGFIFKINKNGIVILILCFAVNVCLSFFTTFSIKLKNWNCTMDIVCFSHLRWNFVYQRPQHLLSRFANTCRVFYIEEPIFDAPQDVYTINKTKENVEVVQLHLQHNPSVENVDRQKKLLDHFLNENKLHDYILWYYTPMALLVSDQLKPKAVVYDCMDELSAFKFASPLLKTLEAQLLAKADVVFTGGHTLYKAKKAQHHNIHPFPSSIDKTHFAQAREALTEPSDQAGIPHPRLGFYGVIDERFDINLIKEAAQQKPDWHFVLIGPVVKIDPAALPRLSNIHYLGGKAYNELPLYLHGWDIALVPFLLNESTRFISPTKTPEYLAGGKPVISTPIQDVVHPYGDEELVHIVNNSIEFIEKAEKELAKTNRKAWLEKTDEFLKDNSWDATWQQMNDLIQKELNKKISSHHSEQIKNNTKKEDAYV